MKKFLVLILTFVMLFSLSTVVFANSGITLNCNLTCDGQNEVQKNTGDIVTVKYTLEKVTDDDAGYIMSSHTNEIYYDPAFFEYIEDSVVVTEGLNLGTSYQKWTNGKRSVAIAGFEPDLITYDSNQVIGTFQLKIIATEGSSTVYSGGTVISSKEGRYNLDTTDLVVKIGDAVVIPKYELSFETNGGTAVSTTKFDEGETVDLSKYKPVRDGYVFEGWYSDEALTEKATSVVMDGDKTVYAKWESEKTQYTLTFSGASITSEKHNEGTVIDLTDDAYQPTKSGYTFGGWYSDSELTNRITEVTLDGHTTIYAKWTKKSTGTGGSSSVSKYTISFEVDGGSEVDSVSKVRNTTVDLSKYITHKEGYSFDGWHTDKDLTEKVTSIKVTENITLYAKWVEGDNGYEDNPNYKLDIFTSEHIAYIVGYEGGYIKPAENLTRAEAATIFFRLIDEQVRTEGMTTENAFTDVNDGDWFNTAVSTLANLEVLKGRTADTFAPNATITRAEFITIVARLSEATYDGDNIFSDTDGHWAEDYINIAASIGWANGDNGKFRPDDNITRAEAMTIVNRATNRLPENTDDLLDGMETFVDNADTEAWYYLNIQEATNSHDFEMKADGVHEKWTKLNENPDWAKIEN